MANGDVLIPMQGVRIWENQKNRFTVFELHYSADEAKRSDEWRDRAKSGMSRRTFQQEYELSWISYSGIPVYGDWKKDFHGSPYKIEPQVGLPLCIGWDFGLCAAALIGQLQGDQLCILKEFTSVNMGAKRFSLHVVQQIRQLFPQWADLRRDWLSFGDPSGAFRKDTDEGTCFQVLDAHGFQTQAGPVAFEGRRQSVENFLVKVVKGEPCLKVNLNECPMFAKGFDGGYRYSDTAAEFEKNTLVPLKNIYSHIHDAGQYLCSGILEASASYRRGMIRVPNPSYGFQKS